VCITIKDKDILFQKYQELQGKNEDGNNDLEMMQLSNAALHNLMMGEMEDLTEVERLNSLKEWYSIINTPIAKYSLAETHFALEEYPEAENVLREIPAKFEFKETAVQEHANYLKFYNFKKNLVQSKRHWSDLSDGEVNELKNIALATNGRSATMARGVLCFFYGICIENDDIFTERSSDTEKPDGEDGVPNYAPQFAPSNSSNAAILPSFDNNVYPNPTTGMIYFYNIVEKIVTLHNETGILLQSTTQNSMDLSKYPSGNYYLKIENQTIKVVKK
jgi:hypothetical protein